MKKSVRVSALLLATAPLGVMLAVGLSNTPTLSPRAVAQQKPSVQGPPPEETRRRMEQRSRLKEIPEIVSATPSLRLVRAEIVSRVSSDEVLLTLRNESPKAMLSVTVCTQIYENGFNSITYSGPAEGDEFIAPHAEKSVEVNAGNVDPGKPLTLCAVMFADETQEGVERVTYSHKQSRDKAKGRRPNQ